MRLTVLLVTAVLFASRCFAQDRSASLPYEKTVEWVDIQVPKFPPLAHAARIFGTVVIQIRFKGCDLDVKSPHILSGHPMLSAAALEAVKHSTIRCGDFANSNALLDYEFGEYYEHPGCQGGPPRVKITGNHVQIQATVPCVTGGVQNQLPLIQVQKRSTPASSSATHSPS